MASIPRSEIRKAADKRFAATKHLLREAAQHAGYVLTNIYLDALRREAEDVGDDVGATLVVYAANRIWRARDDERKAAARKETMQ